MRAHGNRFTDEFKREAVEYLNSKGKTLASSARKFGVSSKALRNWSTGINYSPPSRNLIDEGLPELLPAKNETERKISLLELSVELLRSHPEAAGVLSRLFDLLYIQELRPGAPNGHSHQTTQTEVAS